VTDSFVDDGGRRWWIWIALVAVAATVIRVAYVLGVSRHLDLGADATWYYLQRGTIHDGTGYVDPSTFYSSGKAVATGNFPPVYPAFLAAVRVLGDSVTRAMLAGAPMGGVTVVLTALIARRLADRRVAVVAAVIVAVAPVLVAADGSLMSEVVYTPLVALAVLMALEAGAEGGWWRWGVLGVAVGLAALTRQEAVMLLVLLVAPILWWSELPVRRRLAGVMAAGLVAVLVVAPWVARNQRAVGEAAISTVSPATALAGSNCDATYHVLRAVHRVLGVPLHPCRGPQRHERSRMGCGEPSWRTGLCTIARLATGCGASGKRAACLGSVVAFRPGPPRRGRDP